MKKIWESWSEFWFSPQSLLQLAIFRIVLCGTMSLMYLDRWLDWKLFYSDAALVPREIALKVMPEFYRPPFEWYFWTESQMGIFHGLLVLGLFLLALGIGGRLVAICTWILHIGFLHRNYSVAFGADLIGGIFLMYLALTQSCARLSVLHLWFGKAKFTKPDLVTNTFYRMIQIQLCVIYGYTGFEKLKGSTWWDGTALWSVLANPQMVIADFSWIRFIPMAVVFITFSTILFEIYFPVLVWNLKFRKFFLVTGFFFHAGIGLTMALYSFAIIMLSPYILFLKEEWLPMAWRKSLSNG
jgi:hypothetical protein